MNEGNARRLLPLVFPALAVFLDVLLYYFDDYLDEGRAFTYLDVYGRGFIQWWFDPGSFFGNLELFVLVGVWNGVLAWYFIRSTLPISRVSQPSADRLTGRDRGAITWGVTIGIVTVIFVSIAASGNWNALASLALGWYPSYLPRRAIALVPATSGAWMLIPRLARKSRGRVEPGPWTTRASVLASLAAASLLHLVLVSRWDVDQVATLMGNVSFLLGYLLIYLPLFLVLTSGKGKVARISRDDHETSAGCCTPGPSGKKARRWRDFAFLAILAASAAILVSLLAHLGTRTTFDTGIDIKSDLIPKQFLAWTVAALLSERTCTFLTNGHLPATVKVNVINRRVNDT